MPLVMSISDRVYCLESGIVIAEGTPDEVRENDAVIASYLGTDERAIHQQRWLVEFELTDTVRRPRSSIKPATHQSAVGQGAAGRGGKHCAHSSPEMQGRRIL